ncbi:MAG: IspD/TarI family cytidylyltransferase [Candidatus Nanoarchaeia archaeon]
MERNDAALKKCISEELGIVLAAGGSGKRFAADAIGKYKLFAEFNGLPVFIHSIINFSKACPQKNIVLVVNPDLKNSFLEILCRYFPNSEIKICEGGETRMRSVFNGLLKLPSSLKYAAIHDSARPLASCELLINAFNCAKTHGSAVVAKRIHDTVKRTDKNGFVIEEIPRENLWQIETPQIFLKDDLISAYQKAFSENFYATDDAGVMKFAGHQVKIFENHDKNIKVTFFNDLKHIVAPRV